MNALKISLDWFKDSKGYKINGSGKSRTIVGRGGKLKKTWPLRNDLLFFAFANVKTDFDLEHFVGHYGLLEQPSYDDDFGMTVFDPNSLRRIESRAVLYGEYVDDHLETARMFHDLLALTVDKGRASVALSEWIERRLLGEQLGGLGLDFVSGAGCKVQLKADSLINGMLMQLAQKVSGQPNFRLCSLCNAFFEVGPKTGRRADATFCSPEHKIQFHSRKRSIRSK